MFNCGLCGKTVPPGIKCREVVIRRRRKAYPFREDVNRMATWKEDKQERINSTNDYGGEGNEAALTAKACPQCAKSFAAAEDVGPVAKNV